jgi:hypothetical protein
MPERPKRAREEILSQPATERPSASVPSTAAITIEFRAFDATRIDAEFVSGESLVQAAVDQFESAKQISSRALQARVCL